MRSVGLLDLTAADITVAPRHWRLVTIIRIIDRGRVTYAFAQLPIGLRPGIVPVNHPLGGQVRLSAISCETVHGQDYWFAADRYSSYDYII